MYDKEDEEEEGVTWMTARSSVGSTEGSSERDSSLIMFEKNKRCARIYANTRIKGALQ